MRHSLISLGSAVIVLMLPMTALAPMTDMARCVENVEPPAGMISWKHPKAMHAATDAKKAARMMLPVDQAATLTLLQTPKVDYSLRPAKPGGSVSYGGVVRFTVDQPGEWRVALSNGAWVDVVKDGIAAASTAHGHGPDCTGIRKMVDYHLDAGEYILQLAASGDPQLTVLVTRLP